MSHTRFMRTKWLWVRIPLLLFWQLSPLAYQPINELNSQSSKQVISQPIIHPIYQAINKKIFKSIGWLFDHSVNRSRYPELSLRRGVPKICGKFTGEHPCWSVSSIKLQSSFIEIVLRHGCSPVNLLHIFRTTFPRNTSGWLILSEVNMIIT